MTVKPFKIGTRGSPLALKQADLLQNVLHKAHPDLVIEIIPIHSAADWKAQDGEVSLCEQNGGKGQFAKEIEEKILEGMLDCGVHSLKDMAAVLPEGLVIEHYLERADARDAFISAKYKTLKDLPEGGIVGTCSPRRQAVVLSQRLDLKVVPFRGNVKTRMDKVKNGQVDATYLAMAGLTRLGIEDAMIHPVEVAEMLPACGQGVVCMEMREHDEETRAILDAVNNRPTGLCAEAEREVLKALDGSCHTPIGAYASLTGKMITLDIFVAGLDGRVVFRESEPYECLTAEEARSQARILAGKIIAKLPEGFLS